jgi:hypothetical protein
MLAGQGCADSKRPSPCGRRAPAGNHGMNAGSGRDSGLSCRRRIALSQVDVWRLGFGTRRTHVSELVLEGTRQLDGNRDGNDRSQQRPEPTVNSQLLSHVSTRTGYALHLKNGRSVATILLTPVLTTTVDEPGRGWNQRLGKECNQARMSPVDNRGRT